MRETIPERENIKLNLTIPEFSREGGTGDPITYCGEGMLSRVLLKGRWGHFSREEQDARMIYAPVCRHGDRPRKHQFSRTPRSEAGAPCVWGGEWHPP